MWPCATTTTTMLCYIDPCSRAPWGEYCEAAALGIHVISCRELFCIFRPPLWKMSQLLQIFETIPFFKVSGQSFIIKCFEARACWPCKKPEVPTHLKFQALSLCVCVHGCGCVRLCTVGVRLNGVWATAIRVSQHEQMNVSPWLSCLITQLTERAPSSAWYPHILYIYTVYICIHTHMRTSTPSLVYSRTWAHRPTVSHNHNPIAPTHTWCRWKTILHAPRFEVKANDTFQERENTFSSGRQDFHLFLQTW